jgi:hypothetical protein
VTVPLGASGTVCFSSPSTTHLLADIAGWYGSNGAGFNPVVPSRLLDTREGVGAPSGVRVAGSVLTLQIAGYGGVPVSGATAVTLNVTAVDPTSGGFLTVYPCGSDVPNVSNLNFSAGQTVPNLVTVPLGASGTVCFSSPSTTHLLADIAGWFRG